MSLNALGKKVLFMNKVVDFSSSHNQCLRHNEVQIEEPEKINLIDIKLQYSQCVTKGYTPPIFKPSEHLIDCIIQNIGSEQGHCLPCTSWNIPPASFDAVLSLE